jgi:hypothetical protein
VTGKERRYQRTVETETQAAAALARLLRDVEAERVPDDSATVGLLLDHYLDVADLEVSTREAHEGYIRRTTGLSWVRCGCGSSGLMRWMCCMRT